MDLFDYMRENTKSTREPLASRMRPKKLEDVVGQQHILAKNKFIINTRTIFSANIIICLVKIIIIMTYLITIITI